MKEFFQIPWNRKYFKKWPYKKTAARISFELLFFLNTMTENAYFFTEGAFIKPTKTVATTKNTAATK